MWRRNRICPDTTKRRFLWINGYFRWHFIMQALSRYRWEVYHLKSSRGFLINVRCSIFYMVHFFATSMVQAKYSDYILVSEHSPTIQVFKRMMFFQSGTLHDTNDNIHLHDVTSCCTLVSWCRYYWSRVPIPWLLLIPVDSKLYQSDSNRRRDLASFVNDK